MNTKDSPELNATTLLALRQESDAMRVITERLKVKEMGPADHIRTKHEVKAFIESAGDVKDAEAIVARARARRTLNQAQSAAIKLSEQQQHGRRISD